MNINEVFTHVDSLFENKQTDRVEPYLLACLSQAEAEHDLSAVIPICNELGGFYRALGSYDKGTPLYEKALDALVTLGLKDSEHYATTLINFATNYAVKGEPRTALKIFDEAALLFEKLGLGDDYRVATLHNNMSILCRDLNRHAEALSHLSSAMGILSNLQDSEPEIAITLTNMAQVYLETEDYKAAEENAKKAIEIFDSSTGDSDVHYSAALETLGQVAMASNQPDKALGYFEKAMALTERDYGRESLAYKALYDLIQDCRKITEQGESKK